MLFQLSDEFIERLLNAVLFIAALVFGELALLFLLLDLVDRVAVQVSISF